MNCSEFDRELEQLVEARSGSLTETAMAHAADCAVCSQRWRDYRLLDAALQGWRPVQTPSSLAESVLGQLLQDRSPVPAVANADSRSRWMVVAVAAACLVVVWGLGGMSGPAGRGLALRDKGRITPDVERRPDSGLQPQSQPSVEVASSVAAVFDDLRSEYRELAAETRATAREFAIALPAPTVSPWSDLGSSEVSKPVPSNDGQEISVGIASPGAVSLIGRSIGSQIGEAMDFLWGAVPEGVPRG